VTAPHPNRSRDRVQSVSVVSWDRLTHCYGSGRWDFDSRRAR
jgi:hypothetical protein